jgi:short-subunit dehydrogenase
VVPGKQAFIIFNIERIKMDWQGKIALIAGASSGIGAATARKLAQEKLRVVMVARRLLRLEALAGEIKEAGGQADIIRADLGQESDRARIYDHIRGAFGGIDVLINNAGFGWYGYGSEMPWETARDMLQVNVAAVVHLSLLFLRGMLNRNSGHIINVGSISGGLPSQGVALYGATKSFLDNFTTALYREVKGTSVNLSIVRAGPVVSEFGRAAKSRTGGLRVPTERIGVTTEAVAERIWGLLQAPKRIVYIPRYLAVTPWVENLFGWLIDRLGPLLLRRERGS